MTQDSIEKKYCIFGTGGFGREVLTILIDAYRRDGVDAKDIATFMVSDEYHTDPSVMGIPVIKESEFCVDDFKVVVAVGEPEARKKIVDRMPAGTQYATLIHPTATISQWVELGEGCVIAAGAILTCNICIGHHAHINLNTTIGHDCVIGDFFTAAPAVSISGNCKIGDQVYLGTHSATREGIHLCNDVVVGMSSVVLGSINEKGTYVGSPLRKLD